MKYGRVKVSVTDSDIKRGTREHLCRCPIALAIKRDAKCKAPVFVYGLYFEANRNSYEIRLPKKCQTFVERFDGRKKVKPFSFIANIPAHAIQLP